MKETRIENAMVTDRAHRTSDGKMHSNRQHMFAYAREKFEPWIQKGDRVLEVDGALVVINEVGDEMDYPRLRFEVTG